MRKTFRITRISKLKHGILFAAARKLGSQSALARYLDLPVGLVSYWCNMKACPPKDAENIHPSSNWTADSLAELERKLFELTGQTLIELFPDALRENRGFLEAPKTLIESRDIAMNSLADAREKRLTLPSPIDEAEQKESRERIQVALKSLCTRERNIIIARYGLNGHPPQNYKELGKQFDLSKERVRQIEKKAIKKLADPIRGLDKL